MTKYVSLILACASITFSACSPKPLLVANLGDAVRGQAMTAEYRWIMSLPQAEQGKKPQNIICTEPSPDVAKAVSTALAESLKVDVTHPSGVKVGVSEALQYQTAQAIAQLGKRFATIQILRDILYNDCLAFANGALTPSAYAMSKARFNPLVVTLLSIEMAGGQDPGPLQAISSPQLNADPTGDESQQTKGEAQNQSVGGQKNDVEISQDKKQTAEAAVKKLDESYKKFQESLASLSKTNPATGTLEKNAVDSLQKADKLIAQAVKDADAAWAKVKAAEVLSPDSKAAISKSKQTAGSLRNDTKQKAIIDKAQKDAKAAKKKEAATSLQDLTEKKLSEANVALGALAEVGTTKDDPQNSSGSKLKAGSGADPCCRISISDAQVNAIETMQHTFLENEALAPSLVACAAFYDRQKSDTPIPDTPFTRYCSDVFVRRVETMKRLNELLERLAHEDAHIDIEKVGPIIKDIKELNQHMLTTTIPQK